MFEKLQTAVNALNAQDIIIEAASENTEELADLNVINLEKGLKSDGKRTDTYQSEKYEEFKGSIGSISLPHHDYKVTGDFHDGVFSEIRNNRILFGSTDGKSAKIEQRHGDKLFGVHENQLIETVDAEVVDIIDKKLSNV